MSRRPASLAAALGIIAVGVAVVCLIVGTAAPHRRAALISEDPQAGHDGRAAPSFGSWQRDYLMADPRDYNMAEDIEGLTNSIPLRAQQGGPLHLLKQAPPAAAKAKTPAAVAKHGHALKTNKQQALCGLGSGCEHESEQNVGSAQVVANSRDPTEVAKRAAFDAIDTDHSGELDFEEIKAYLPRLGIDMPDYDIEAMIQRGDTDGGGTLSMAELDRLFSAPPPRPVSNATDAVMEEIKGAVAEYQQEEDRQMKIAKGDVDPTVFTARAGSAVLKHSASRTQSALKGKQSALKGGGKGVAMKVKGRRMARTQVLCGIDAGCEDDMDNEVNNAALVDAQTVNANMPGYPADETIDEVYKAMADKKALEENADRQRRGTEVAN